MCGIFGYSSPSGFDQRIRGLVPILANAMSFRGTHSWGITNGLDFIHKDVGDIMDNLGVEYVGMPQFAGHTRHATTGDKTAENSHPFKIGDIIGMHNGMIYNHKDVAEKYGYDYQVDSELIFQQIVNNRPISDLEGYGAIQYFRDGRIYLGRFNNGELTIAKTEFGIVWASTKKSVANACRLAGVKIEFYYQVDECQLYHIGSDGVLYKDNSLTLDIKYKPKGATWQNSGVNNSMSSHYLGTGSAQRDCYCSEGHYVCMACRDKGKTLPGDANKPPVQSSLPGFTVISGGGAKTDTSGHPLWWDNEDVEETINVGNEYGTASDLINREFNTSGGRMKIVTVGQGAICSHCPAVLDSAAFEIDGENGAIEVLCDKCADDYAFPEEPTEEVQRSVAVQTNNTGRRPDYAMQFWETRPVEFDPTFQMAECGFCDSVMSANDKMFTNRYKDALCTTCFDQEIRANCAEIIQRPSLQSKTVN